MDTHKLEIFRKIAELKSYSLAAGMLSLTQSTISHHITELETSLGLPLFDRKGKEILLTPAGEILYKRSHRISAVVEQAQQTLSFYKGKKCGRLTIAAGNLLGEYILPAYLKQLLDVCPDATGSISIASCRDVIARISAGEADLGFIGLPVADSRLQCSQFFTCELALIVPRGHRWQYETLVHADDIRREPFIARLDDSCLRSACDDQLQTFGIILEQLNTVIELNNITAVKEAVKSGYGVALLPLPAVTEEIASGAFSALTVEGYHLEKKFYIIHDRKPHLSPLCAEFMNTLGLSTRPA